MHVREAEGILRVWDAESGQLHRQLEGSEGNAIMALASFVSADGQQARLVVGSWEGHVRMYDPEAGSVLLHVRGHDYAIVDLACIVSSSAPPHHSRLVAACSDRTAQVWDGETGDYLADLGGNGGPVTSVVVWKEHLRGRDQDRIATASGTQQIKVWDGEALTLLHDLECDSLMERLFAFKSAEGPCHLVAVRYDGSGLQIWEPEEGRLLHSNSNRISRLEDSHLFESAEGRYLLAIKSSDDLRQTQRPAFLDVWDLGEAAADIGQMRPAHKHG
jgi:WD40 repeat protein